MTLAWLRPKDGASHDGAGRFRLEAPSSPRQPSHVRVLVVDHEVIRRQGIGINAHKLDRIAMVELDDDAGSGVVHLALNGMIDREDGNSLGHPRWHGHMLVFHAIAEWAPVTCD